MIKLYELIDLARSKGFKRRDPVAKNKDYRIIGLQKDDIKIKIFKIGGKVRTINIYENDICILNDISRVYLLLYLNENFKDVKIKNNFKNRKELKQDLKDIKIKIERLDRVLWDHIIVKDEKKVVGLIEELKRLLEA